MVAIGSRWQLAYLAASLLIFGCKKTTNAGDADTQSVGFSQGEENVLVFQDSGELYALKCPSKVTLKDMNLSINALASEPRARGCRLLWFDRNPTAKVKEVLLESTAGTNTIALTVGAHAAMLLRDQIAKLEEGLKALETYTGVAKKMAEKSRLQENLSIQLERLQAKLAKLKDDPQNAGLSAFLAHVEQARQAAMQVSEAKNGWDGPDATENMLFDLFFLPGFVLEINDQRFPALRDWLSNFVQEASINKKGVGVWELPNLLRKAPEPTPLSKLVDAADFDVSLPPSETVEKRTGSIAKISAWWSNCGAEGLFPQDQVSLDLAKDFDRAVVTLPEQSEVAMIRFHHIASNNGRVYTDPIGLKGPVDGQVQAIASCLPVDVYRGISDGQLEAFMRLRDQKELLVDSHRKNLPALIFNYADNGSVLGFVLASGASQDSDFRCLPFYVPDLPQTAQLRAKLAAAGLQDGSQQTLAIARHCRRNLSE